MQNIQSIAVINSMGVLNRLASNSHDREFYDATPHRHDVYEHDDNPPPEIFAFAKVELRFLLMFTSFLQFLFISSSVSFGFPSYSPLVKTGNINKLLIGSKSIDCSSHYLLRCRILPPQGLEKAPQSSRSSLRRTKLFSSLVQQLHSMDMIKARNYPSYPTIYHFLTHYHTGMMSLINTNYSYLKTMQIKEESPIVGIIVSVYYLRMCTWSHHRFLARRQERSKALDIHLSRYHSIRQHPHVHIRLFAQWKLLLEWRCNRMYARREGGHGIGSRRHRRRHPSLQQ